MIKKLLCGLIFLTTLFLVAEKAQAEIKINSINFDSSDSALVLFAGKKIMPEDEISVSPVSLSDNRVYYDIKNAVLTQPNRIWTFKNSSMEKIRLSQFSTAPNVVRIVFYYKDGFSPEKIKVLKCDNNIIFKFDDRIAKGAFLFNIYREDSSGFVDYYDKTTYFEEGKARSEEPSATVSKLQDDSVFLEIQQALGQTDIPLPPAAVQRYDPKFEKDMQYRLKSKYFVDAIDVKSGNILISGVGTISLEKPLYLSDPSRVVFDLPNTILAKELRNQEFYISEKETVKAGQFDQTKTRIVITTDNPQKYRPIYSANLQGMLISNDEKIKGINLSNNQAPICSITPSAFDKNTDVITLNFASSIVHSLKNDGKKLELILYNATGLNEAQITNIFAKTKLSNIKIESLDKIGYKLLLPVQKTTSITVWQTLDSKILKLQIKNTPEKKQPAASTLPTNNVIIIDPGHGGLDAGAIKAGINEKDINLDVSKRIAGMLVNKGYNIELTRWQDQTLSLQERVDFSESKNPVCFLSVHVNSSVKSEVCGLETHYYKDNSLNFAKIVHSKMTSMIKSKDRGLFQSKFYVINHTTAPAILVEIGFLSNDEERNNLLSETRKQDLAKAVCAGIIEFVSKQSK